VSKLPWDEILIFPFRFESRAERVGYRRMSWPSMGERPILCGYGDTRDEGRVTLPEEARKRITEERPGEFAAEGYRTASKFGIERTGVSFSKVNP
jgi:hypothetical protein